MIDTTALNSNGKARSRRFAAGLAVLTICTTTCTTTTFAADSDRSPNSVVDQAAARSSEHTIQIVPRLAIVTRTVNAPAVSPEPVAEKEQKSGTVSALAQVRRPYEDVFGSQQTNGAKRQPVDDGMAVIVPQAIRSPSYADVYRSIPFDRAEYMANPSYRHETTMELLFNQLRPVTIFKYPPPAPPSDGIGYMTPYYYVRPGYRANFNFWYPMPTVYRNY